MKNSFIALIFLLQSLITIGQAPLIQWQKCLGGSNSESGGEISTMIITLDNSYILTGQTMSNDGDVTGNNGGTNDGWVIKVDSNGNIEWQNCYGGTMDDNITSILQLNDSVLVLAGNTNSNDGDIVGNHSTNNDIFLIKIDLYGNVLLNQCIGGSNDEINPILEKTNDNNFIITATTNSNDGDVTGNHSLDYDIWVAKLDLSFNIIWQKCYGGTSSDLSRTILTTSDNGYVFSSVTQSTNGDVTGFNGMQDIWIVKLDSIGNIIWENCYGGSMLDDVSTIKEIGNNFILGGGTGSINGDVSNNYGGTWDAWILKLNQTGNIIWENNYGGSSTDFIYEINVNNNSFEFTGITHSNDNDVSFNNGTADVWIVRIDSLGSIIWEKCYGGSGVERGENIYLTTDNCLIFSGITYSNDLDVTGNHGNSSTTDFWLVKLEGILGINSQNKDFPMIYPNPSDGKFQFENIKPEFSNINILDINGKNVCFNQINGNFDLGTNPNGIYFLQIESNSKLYFLKLIKIE